MTFENRGRPAEDQQQQQQQPQQIIPTENEQIGECILNEM